MHRLTLSTISVICCLSSDDLSTFGGICSVRGLLSCRNHRVRTNRRFYVYLPSFSTIGPTSQHTWKGEAFLLGGVKNESAFPYIGEAKLSRRIQVVLSVLSLMAKSTLSPQQVETDFWKSNLSSRNYKVL
jgi:hypothetical protein